MFRKMSNYFAQVVLFLTFQMMSVVICRTVTFLIDFVTNFVDVKLIFINSVHTNDSQNDEIPLYLKPQARLK